MQYNGRMIFPTGNRPRIRRLAQDFWSKRIKHIYVLFVDYKQSYDSINRESYGKARGTGKPHENDKNTDPKLQGSNLTTNCRRNIWLIQD